MSKWKKNFPHLHPTMWTNQITPFSSSLHPEAYIVSSNSLVKKNCVGSMLWWDVIPTYSSRMQAYISHILEKLPKVKKLLYNPQHFAHNRCSIIIFKWMNEWELTSLGLVFYKFKVYETFPNEYAHMAAGCPLPLADQATNLFQTRSSSKQKVTQRPVAPFNSSWKYLF